MRQHRAAERLIKRLGQVLLGLGADIESAALVSEAFDVENALLAGPGKILHAETDDMNGEIVRFPVERLAEVAGRSAAGLLAIGKHDDHAWLGAIVGSPEPWALVTPDTTD